MKKILKNHVGSLLLLLAAIAGLLLGPLFPKAAAFIKPIGTLWLNLLFTAVVPLVFFSIASTVAGMTDARKFGKIIVGMLFVFVLTGVIASILMLGVVHFFPPMAPTHLSLTTQLQLSSVSALDKIISALSSGDFVDLLSRKNMLALIIFAGLMGWAAFAS